MPQRFTVATIPGDGIDPEVVEAALPAIERAAALSDAELTWKPQLLEQLGLDEGAAALQRAVRAALDEGVTTPDLGGSAGTAEVGQWIAYAMA